MPHRFRDVKRIEADFQLLEQRRKMMEERAAAQSLFKKKRGAHDDLIVDDGETPNIDVTKLMPPPTTSFGNNNNAGGNNAASTSGRRGTTPNANLLLLSGGANRKSIVAGSGSGLSGTAVGAAAGTTTMSTTLQSKKLAEEQNLLHVATPAVFLRHRAPQIPLPPRSTAWVSLADDLDEDAPTSIASSVREMPLAVGPAAATTTTTSSVQEENSQSENNNSNNNMLLPQLAQQETDPDVEMLSASASLVSNSRKSVASSNATTAARRAVVGCVAVPVPPAAIPSKSPPPLVSAASGNNNQSQQQQNKKRQQQRDRSVDRDPTKLRRPLFPDPITGQSSTTFRRLIGSGYFAAAVGGTNASAGGFAQAGLQNDSGVTPNDDENDNNDTSDLFSVLSDDFYNDDPDMTVMSPALMKKIASAPPPQRRVLMQALTFASGNNNNNSSFQQQQSQQQGSSSFEASLRKRSPVRFLGEDSMRGGDRPLSPMSQSGNMLQRPQSTGGGSVDLRNIAGLFSSSSEQQQQKPRFIAHSKEIDEARAAGQRQIERAKRDFEWRKKRDSAFRDASWLDEKTLDRRARFNLQRFESCLPSINAPHVFAVTTPHQPELLTVQPPTPPVEELRRIDTGGKSALRANTWFGGPRPESAGVAHVQSLPGAPEWMHRARYRAIRNRMAEHSLGKNSNNSNEHFDDHDDNDEEEREQLSRDSLASTVSPSAAARQSSKTKQQQQHAGDGKQNKNKQQQQQDRRKKSDYFLCVRLVRSRLEHASLASWVFNAEVTEQAFPGDDRVPANHHHVFTGLTLDPESFLLFHRFSSEAPGNGRVLSPFDDLPWLKAENPDFSRLDDRQLRIVVEVVHPIRERVVDTIVQF